MALFDENPLHAGRPCTALAEPNHTRSTVTLRRLQFDTATTNAERRAGTSNHCYEPHGGRQGERTRGRRCSFFSSAAGSDSSAAGITRLAAAEEPVATGDAGSGRAGRTGFGAPCGCGCSVRSTADVERLRRRHSRRRHPERGAVRSLQPVSKHSPNQPRPASQLRRCVEPAGVVSPTLPPFILFRLSSPLTHPSSFLHACSLHRIASFVLGK